MMKKNLLHPKNKLLTFLFSVFILFFSSCEESDAPSKIQNPDLILKINTTTKKAILKKDWNYIKSHPNVLYKNNSFGPYLINGKIVGYKIYSVDVNGILPILGFSSGDIMIQLNGYAEDFPKAASTKIMPWVVDIQRKEEYYRYEFTQIENNKDHKKEDILNFESIFNSSEVNKSKVKKAIKAEKEEEEDIQNKIAPVNPETGKQYSVEEMKQFAELKKEMSDNLLIPKYMSQEETLEKQKFEERIKDIFRKMQTKTESGDEAEIFFHHNELIIKNRIQILEYLIKDAKEDGDDPDKIKSSEDMILKSNQQLKELKKQKKNYLKILRDKK